MLNFAGLAAQFRWRTQEARERGFKKALEFENRVREVIQEVANAIDSGAIKCPEIALNGNASLDITVDMNPPAQGFPDIVLGNVGVEVKFTESDTWRCIANSVLKGTVKSYAQIQQRHL